MIDKTALINFYRFFLGRYNLGYRLHQEIADHWRVLDVGCGKRPALQAIGRKIWPVGIDHYEPYIRSCRSTGAYGNYTLGDGRQLPFKSNSFDCLVAIEVLEHLNKKDAHSLLEEMERVAEKKIILTTPNGFLPTQAGPEDNPEETHLSGWTVGELHGMGFDVYGISGLKTIWVIRNGKAVLRFIPEDFPVLRKIVTDISGFLVHNRPRYAFQLLLIKNVEHSHA